MTPRGPVAMPGALRRAIAAHARRDAPNECCGLLLGKDRRVLFALPMLNVDPHPVSRFRIDDGAHIAVRRWVRRLAPSLDIVGVYHSHPRGPAAPSASDLAEAHYEEWVYVILDLAGQRARLSAFEIRDGKATRVPVIQEPRRRAR